MNPMIMRGMHNTAVPIISANIEATMWRGYRPFMGCGESGPVTIVGAAPSLAATYKRISGDVIACNSAHDFLIKNGIVPKYAMIWDANPVMEQIVHPHRGVKYLIASRCHETVFKKFEGYDVTVWHALGDDHLDWILKRYKKNEHTVCGGTSSVTRAMFIAADLGYRGAIHLHGVDGSYASNGDTHVLGSVVRQDKFRIMVCGKMFSVAPWMALQGDDFKVIVPIFKYNGFSITVHGTGLIPYCASFLGCETPDLKVGWLEKNIRRPLGSLQALYTLLRKSPQLLGGLSHAGI